jgi:hypothetical protein
MLLVKSLMNTRYSITLGRGFLWPYQRGLFGSKPGSARLIIGLLVCLSSHGAEPVFRIAKASAVALNRVQNGGFELVQKGQLAYWSPYADGFTQAMQAGRNGSAAVVCQNDQTSGGRGAVQGVELNQREPVPLIVKGWSKAENVSGSADSGYSVYVDLVFSDGTSLWGQTANFRCGTHDWEAREITIMPEKPVKRLSVYALFRGHSGRAWFDDLSIEELQAGQGVALFQGASVLLPDRAEAKTSGIPSTHVSKDLVLAMNGQRVHSLAVKGEKISSAGPSGFMARDVQGNSDFFGFEAGECRDLGLRIEAEVTTLKHPGSHFLVRGKLTDLQGKDRAVTLVFALPVDAQGWQWGEDIRRSRTIKSGDYVNQVSVRCGATGMMSQYPVGGIWNERQGLALALDMAKPAVYRIGYHAGTRQLYIAYDFGLVKETSRFPSAAEFQFVICTFDPRWGFRGAFKSYMRLFPDYFAVRSRDQGIWMPFTDISTVQDWQDFGFKYHEGNNNVRFDDANGILSFRYTEPMTWWMPMAKDLPRTPETALKVRDELLNNGKPSQKIPAQVTKTSAMHDETGAPVLAFRDAPWCNGAVWSLNPNPDLPGEINFARWHWGETIKNQLYGPQAKGQLDGEYLDSLEGYVTADLNFRREHFAYTSVPLAFESVSKHPALFKGLTVFEFTKWFCDDVHRLGKLTFANSVPYRFTFLCPWLDVMGTETDWNPGGKWRPPGDATLCLWRTMSGAKPYLLLMNTRFDAFTVDRVEKYFQRCAFYGFYPSMFSHNASEDPYWKNPVWYNRDRALFKQYLPIIKRVAEAGWQPVPYATVSNTNLWLERFGEPGQGRYYVTAFNQSAQTQRGTLGLSPEATMGKTSVSVVELLRNQPQTVKAHQWELSMESEQVMVFEITTGNPSSKR